MPGVPPGHPARRANRGSVTRPRAVTHARAPRTRPPGGTWGVPSRAAGSGTPGEGLIRSGRARGAPPWPAAAVHSGGQAAAAHRRGHGAAAQRGGRQPYGRAGRGPGPPTETPGTPRPPLGEGRGGPRPPLGEDPAIRGGRPRRAPRGGRSGAPAGSAHRVPGPARPPGPPREWPPGGSTAAGEVRLSLGAEAKADAGGRPARRPSGRPSGDGPAVGGRPVRAWHGLSIARCRSGDM